MLRDKCREQKMTGTKTNRKLVMHDEMQGKGQFSLGRGEITQQLSSREKYQMQKFD